MKPIKMIAIDIDGTLLNSKKELTLEVKQALKQAKEQGVYIVLSTGRPTKGIEALLKELELSGGNQYAISYNGALVQSVDQENVIADYGLTIDDISVIRRIAKTLDVPYHVINKEAIYTTNKDIGKYTIHEATLVGMPLKYRTYRELKVEEFSAQKAMFVDEAERLDEVIKKIPQSFSNRYFLVKSSPFYLEVLNKKANKGQAVRALAKYLGIDLKQVMAIGDNENDLDMLAIVGHGVAMGNAVESLKQAARYITETNDRNGVAKIVNELVNNQ